MLKVLLLQLFWLSFIAIGLSAFTLLSEHKPKNKFLVFINGTHLLIKLFIALSAGMAIFAIAVVPACIFELPLWVVGIVYFLLLGNVLIQLLRSRQGLLSRAKKIKMSKQSQFWLIAVGGLMLLDYRTALFTGGLLEGDAKFQIAQINLFASKGLSFTDPIFGNQGVPVSVFSASIIHSLEALASDFLGRSAAWVWFYSHAFFRLLSWISIFAVAWELLGRKIRGNWPYIILSALPFIYGANSLQAQLHYKTAMIWTALLIIGIKIWLNNKNTLLIYIGAILLASTHPLNAVMGAMFICLIVFWLLITRHTKLKQFYSLVPVVLILLLPMVLYNYYSHAISSVGFNDRPLSGPFIQIRHLGPVFVGSIDFRTSFLTVIINAAILAAILVSRKIKNIRLRVIMVVLLLCCLFLETSLNILALAGYCYLIIKANNKLERILIALLIIFLGLLIYNPLFMTLFHNRLPTWSISRFQDFNLLVFIAPVTGFLYILTFPFKGLKHRKFSYWSGLSVIALVILIPALFFPVAASRSLSPMQESRKPLLNKVEELNQFDSQLTGQVVFSDDLDTLNLLPEVVNVNLFVIYNESNANPAIHIIQRKQCAELLERTLKSSDLKNSGITAIITRSAPKSRFGELIKSNPDIKLVKEADGYFVYSVSLRNQEPESSRLCKIPPTKKRAF